MEYGDQCVIMVGIMLVLFQSVISWDIKVLFVNMLLSHWLSTGGDLLHNSYFGIKDNTILLYYSRCFSRFVNLQHCIIKRTPYNNLHCNNYHEAGVRCERMFNKVYVYYCCLFYSSLCSWSSWYLWRSLKLHWYCTCLYQWNME